MPRFSSDQLHHIACCILTHAGVTETDADLIAEELTEANLVGHDSHGVMRLMQYVNSIHDGDIRPDGEFRIVRQTGSVTQIDGGFHFGQVIARRALDHAYQSLQHNPTATVFVKNCNHVGRLGSYTTRAAGQNVIALMVVNAPGPGGVAPFGGIERRLGTNPLSFAAPWNEDAIVLDMTSSATAEGKVRVALQKGQRIPEGWVIDAEGRPSTDPADLYGPPKGAILPLGGAQGFKGYGLSVMIDLLGGILSGSGICRTDVPPGANGIWMHLIDINQLMPRSEYDAMLTLYTSTLKATQRMEGVDEILLPGEIEQRRRAERITDGIDVPEETWQQLCDLATQLGTTLDV